MLYNICVLIVILALSLVIAAVFICWFPREQTLIITILAIFLIIIPFLLPNQKHEAFLPPAVVPLNPASHEHAHPGRYSSVVTWDPAGKDAR